MTDGVPGEDLLVLGAGAGPGRWLAERLFTRIKWRSVTLVDTASSVDKLHDLAAVFTAAENPTTVAVVSPGEPAVIQDASDGSPIEPGSPDLLAVLAVPERALISLGSWLGAAAAATARVGVVTESFVTGHAAVARSVDPAQVFCVHALIDSYTSEIDGKTIVLTPNASRLEGTLMANLAEDAGAIVEFASNEEHDEIMSFIQTMTFQMLFGFTRSVVDSGKKLEELWAFRTPLFELLFGLSARVLAEGRESHWAALQSKLDGDRVFAHLTESLQASGDGLLGGSPEAAIAALRDEFSGSLFETARASATVALAATQAKRTELARRHKQGDLIGLTTEARPDVLRVGRIEGLTPTQVMVRELMRGEQGKAVLLDGPGLQNAKDLGIAGQPGLTTFGLAHIDLVLDRELDGDLDRWLGSVGRDVRFLVPESISGDGVALVVGKQQGVLHAALRSEVVRTGQRSVVVAVQIRADRDVNATIELLRAAVHDVYLWPRGIALPSVEVGCVHHLGPAGTFSEFAAEFAASEAGRSTEALRRWSSFDAVLAALGDQDLAVLPITSSASGLVGKAVHALLGHENGEIVAGGVVDVAVRFDAYVRSERVRDDLRGRRVYSHPQALAQCQNYVRRWGLQPTECASTTDALATILNDDPEAVALAGPLVSPDEQLLIAEREVDDLSGSITRFLILGRPEIFGALVGGSDPTLRNLWIAPRLDALASLVGGGGAALHELLTAQDGAALLVTSSGAPAGGEPAADGSTTSVPVSLGARPLGRAPWSPRTPVVRVV